MDRNMTAFAALKSKSKSKLNRSAHKEKANLVKQIILEQKTSFENHFEDEFKNIECKNLMQNKSPLQKTLKKKIKNGTGNTKNVTKMHFKIKNKKQESTKTKSNGNLNAFYANLPAKQHSTPVAKDIKKHKTTLNPEVSVNKYIKSEVNLDEAPRNSSIEDGQGLFKWLISPVEIDNFMSEYWEQKPFLIQRKNPSYYKNLMSMSLIDKTLRDEKIEYTKNVDITSYKDGQRMTHNPNGRAKSPEVWSFYNNGCSIRLLNPQTFFPTVYTMNSTLQEYFQCMVGANSYLTPANSQGFAPHYDDIEAFILQIEGKKHWQLYAPRNKFEYLARTSSGNFKQDEIGKPILDIILEEGDLLYFPRGTIHQANTVENCHSLHLTLSVYQKNSWSDLLELLLPAALSVATEEDIDFRRGLPFNLGQCMGLINSDADVPERQIILNKIKKFFDKLFQYAPIDDAVDQLQKRFQHDALPPEITNAEKLRTVFGVSLRHNNKGTIKSRYNFNINTRFRLLRANILRLVMEEESVRVYYHVDNSKEYHEYDSVYLEIDNEVAPTIEIIIKLYPQYISVNEMPVEDPVKSLSVLTQLWENGLLMNENIVI